MATHETTPDLKKQATRAVSIGATTIGAGNFTVIAGPCSIESKEQFSSIASQVLKEGANIVRGGIWKMRTSPDTFQGLGHGGLQMIKEILAENKAQLISEITDPRQMEILDDVVSIYQVGSRNMHNYELLKELGNSRKPVMIKRGFAALISEWLKSAEYLLKGGNENVILCERGIRTFETATRNTLDLNAVAYIKENTPFPIIVDPSHGVGIRALVPKMALAAVAAGADGIIVEVHPEPEKALSDGMQTLNYAEFSKLMKQVRSICFALKEESQESIISENLLSRHHADIHP